MKILASVLAALVTGAAAVAFAQNIQLRPHATLPAPEASVQWQKQKEKDAPPPEYTTPEPATLHCELLADTYEEKQPTRVDPDCANQPGRTINLPPDASRQVDTGGAPAGDHVADTPRVQGPAFTVQGPANVSVGAVLPAPNTTDASHTKTGSSSQVQNPPVEQRVFTPSDFRIRPPSDTDDDDDDDDDGKADPH
jgi:hypothetical protein